MKSVLYIFIIVGGISVLLFTLDQFDVFNSNLSRDYLISDRGNVFISTNGGNYWHTTQTNNNKTSFVLNAMQYYVEGNNLNMLAGTNQGLFLSNNNGINWNSAFRNQVGSNEINDLIVGFQQEQAIIYIATRDKESNLVIFRSKDGGDSFQKKHLRSNAEQEIVGIEIDANNPNILYALLSDGAFFKSSDSGDSWIYRNITTPYQDVFRYFFVHPSSADIVFAISDKNVYKSINGGLNWRQTQHFEDETIHSVHIDETNGSIYIGTEQKVYFSDSIANSFTELAFNFIQQDDATPVKGLYTNPKDNSLYIGAGQTLYKTTDRGYSWSVIQVNDILYNINFIWVNPTNQQMIYVGSQLK